MIGKLNGKKLLVLGSNVMAEEIVQYARGNGAYVIVADYYPKELSPAKKLADEAVNISTLDIESLSRLCQERKIDGVFSGVSEYNLLAAMRVSEKAGLRFIFDMEQWNKLENKEQFRALCIEHGVPCPREYYAGTIEGFTESVRDSVCFPAVVKPVDCASSEGVSFCNCREELVRAAEEASGLSKAHRIIVEQYMEGDEFTAHYTICGGKAVLSCMDNRYPAAVNSGNVTTIPIARVYPSLFLNDYLESVNTQMIALCEDLHFQDAVVFVQGIYNRKTRKFGIFEAGLRSAAELPCRIYEKVTGQNHVFMLVDSLLLGHADYDLSKEDPSLCGMAGGIVSFVTRGGIVGTIEGLAETVKKVPSILFYENKYPIGKNTPCGNTLRQLMLRFGMICQSREKMVEDIRFINDHISVKDTQGKDMVIKMDPERLLTEFQS